MIDWAPEAIEAAHCAMFQEPYDGKTAALIGAGLDAAAAAQGIKDEENTRLREENARLRGDFTAKSEIVKLAEQQVEIERLRAENERLQDLLREANEKLDKNNLWNRIAAPIREGGKE